MEISLDQKPILGRTTMKSRFMWIAMRTGILLRLVMLGDITPATPTEFMIAGFTANTAFLMNPHIPIVTFTGRAGVSGFPSDGEEL